MQKLGEILIAAGIVVVSLLLFSIVAIALIVERLVFWTGSRSTNQHRSHDRCDLCNFDVFYHVNVVSGTL